MIIEELSNKDEQAWDNYVKTHDNTTFYHLIGWKELIEKVYNQKPIYLMARDEEAIQGILPLFLVKNKFLGKRLISIPFAIIGGVCAMRNIAKKMLIDKAIELTKSLDCDYLELRHLKEENRSDLKKNSDYFSFLLDLRADHEELWKNLRKTYRNLIRRAKKNDLQIKLNSNNLRKFYDIYSIGQRDLGTPIQSFSWIRNLFFDFSNNHTIATVEHNGKIISVFLLRYFNDTVSGIYAYSLKEYRHLYPTHLLYWELIKDSCEKGLKWFDFGRSIKTSGTYFFKNGWHAKPIQLNYQYYLNKARKIPNTSQANLKRQLFAKVWKRLPLSVANTLGPAIRKYFP